MKQIVKFVFRLKMMKKLIKFSTVMDVILVSIKFVMVYQKSKLMKLLKWKSFIVMFATTHSLPNLQVQARESTAV